MFRKSTLFNIIGIERLCGFGCLGNNLSKLFCVVGLKSLDRAVKSVDHLLICARLRRRVDYLLSYCGEIGDFLCVVSILINCSKSLYNLSDIFACFDSKRLSCKYNCFADSLLCKSVANIESFKSKLFTFSVDFLI